MQKYARYAKYANLDIKFNNAVLQIGDHGGYESRHKSMINLIRDAWQTYIRNEGRPEPLRFFTLYTDDCFNPELHFSFAISQGGDLRRCMPNFIFDSWPSCGIEDYQSTFDEMVAEGSKPYEFERAFWTGVIHEAHPQTLRHLGSSLSVRRSDLIDFRPIEWGQRGPDQFKRTPGYVSLPYHCKYRVLIDFGGIGFSARLPLLLASGRPLVILGRPQESWFYWDGSLIPWEHYIPCGPKDGVGTQEGDLESALQWTFENMVESEEIGARGRQYAVSNLTRSCAVKRIGMMMSQFCKEMWGRD